MTRTRRRGPTCHRSVRHGHSVPWAAAIRLVRGVRQAAGARAVPAGPGFPFVPAALVPATRILVPLVPAPRVPIAPMPAPRVPIAPMPAPRVLVPLTPAPRVLVAPMPATRVLVALIPAPRVPVARAVIAG